MQFHRSTNSLSHFRRIAVYLVAFCSKLHVFVSI